MILLIFGYKMLKRRGIMNKYAPEYIVVLCGFMGCGKSTVGRRLASALGVPYYDTDDMLTRETGMTAAEMFAAGGEAYFRDMEHEVVKKAAALPCGVIATGGGVMTFERNAKLLAERAAVIHVCRSFEGCYDAVSKRKNRPIAGTKSREELERLYNGRIAAYEKYADYTLMNDGTPDEAAARALAFLQSEISG